MWRYTHEDKIYDVGLLSDEAQATFQLLATVQKRIVNFQSDLTIAQAAAVALHQKMQEYLEDIAIVEDDETED